MVLINPNFLAAAEIVDTISQKTLRPSEVLALTQGYSIQHPDTIGVFINLAPDTQATPEKLGEAIAILFKREVEVLSEKGS